MSTEENKALIQRFWNEVSKGNLDIWDELCAPGYIYHSPAGDMTWEQSKQHAAGILATFADFYSDRCHCALSLYSATGSAVEP